MIIYFVRHGETDWNAAGRFQGREDIPLNESGLAQADALAEKFRGMDVRTIISSPLMRACQTADSIGRLFPESVRRVDDRLIERDLGGLSGLTKPERLKLRELGPIADIEPLEDVMKRMYACLCDADAEDKGISGAARLRQYALAGNICSGVGEGTTDSAAVVRDTMKYGGHSHTDPADIRFTPTALTEAERGAPCIVMVSHGAAINALLSLLTDGDIGSGRTVLRNACISMVRETAEGFKVLEYDVVDHI